MLISLGCTNLQLLAPQGEKGEPGEAGMSAYKIWLSLIQEGKYPEWKDRQTEADFLLFLTGKNSQKGRTAYEEWKGMISKGDVADPHNPGATWSAERNTLRDFFWFLTAAKGKPETSDESAEDGSSAYEVWVEMVKKGNLKNPHPTFPGYGGEFWPKDKSSLEDFWVYLRGEDGKSTKEIIADYILSFQHVQVKEGGAGYNLSTGDAVLRLTDRDSKPVEQGTAVIFGTQFGLPQKKQYSVGADGTITIPRKDLLPNGTPVNKRVARAKLTIKGKEEQTNIFVFPTQVAFKEGGWNIRNDWAPGLVRATARSSYLFDASGSLAMVELDQRVKERTYSEVYKEWTGTKGDAKKDIVFEITDINGKVLATSTDARVKDEWYARSEGDPVARRPLYRKSENDTHKTGHNFHGDDGRTFSNDSYYVRTKPLSKYFGIPGSIQSPIVEVPPMPRIPLLKHIKFESGKATGEFEALEQEYMNKTYSEYEVSSTNPDLLVPKYTSFNGMALNILITKVNTSYTGAAKVGQYHFEFTVASNPKDLVGCKVFLAGPEGFTPVTSTAEANPVNQQPHFRPVQLGTIELSSDGKAQIKYSSDLGASGTHVPQKQ